MSHIPTDIPQFYLTSPSPCPYLDGREERKVFTHLVGEDAKALNDMLTQGGFRRSQNIAYRPACDSCKACKSIRVDVANFQPSKSHRRVIKKNRDIIPISVGPWSTNEQYSIFRSYLEARHSKGGMANMSVMEYSMMIEESHVDTGVIEYRYRDADSGVTQKSTGKLVGVALTDQMSDGLSMVYSFYDPELATRSLGTLMILDHIDRAKRLGVPYLYLGYWVKDSSTMDYKARFRPLEVLDSKGWQSNI
ncbi:MAG: arginyltransferase [Hyphomicrobiales bacterium]|nr:MAG: arginyltransferase [Hyphomicrobiales bacterium]